MSTPKLSLTCPVRSTLPSEPFRFTDLPQELMNLIITHYYEPYSLSIWMWEIDQTIQIVGVPSRSIELVSRELRAVALSIFKECFNGILSVSSHHKSGPSAVLSKLSTMPQMEWLMDRIRIIELPYSLQRWNAPHSDDVVKNLVIWFPSLEAIYLSFLVTKRDSMSDKFVQALADDGDVARKKLETFFGGGRDQMFARPITLFEFKELPRLLEARGANHVKVFLDIQTRWGSPSHGIFMSQVSQSGVVAPFIV